MISTSQKELRTLTGVSSISSRPNGKETCDLSRRAFRTALSSSSEAETQKRQEEAVISHSYNRQRTTAPIPNPILHTPSLGRPYAARTTNTVKALATNPLMMATLVDHATSIPRFLCRLSLSRVPRCRLTKEPPPLPLWMRWYKLRTLLPLQHPLHLARSIRCQKRCE